MRFGIITVVTMKITVFLSMTPHSTLEIYRLLVRTVSNNLFAKPTLLSYIISYGQTESMTNVTFIYGILGLIAK